MLSSDLARIRAFEVVPSLPEAIKPLLKIAHNLWWTWHPEAQELFERLDRKLWESCSHNPVKMLGVCPQEILDDAARDEGFLNSLAQVEANLERHMTRTPWHRKHLKTSDPFTVAYFCAEFGLTECLQVYAGGLGCLAGDHLKSAAELGLPLVGVGLLYRNGYFQQYLNADGWQQEYYPDLDFSTLPISPVRDKEGNQVQVTVSLPGREVVIAVWQVNVGRVRLFLLDTNRPENNRDDRAICSQLYGGDMDVRIKQEIVLGIGGVRALQAVGIEPDVCHMNEGHSAFLALERIRQLIAKYDTSFDEARQYAAASHVFTTHTPVPAGIDRFPAEMIQRYFRNYHEGLRLDMEGLLALGRENVTVKNEFFSMAVLALRTSDWANGVSRLHGDVSRSMWKRIWPGLPENEVPITHVTNGVHARSWLSPELIRALDRYLGARWQDSPTDQSVWRSINEVPDEELWRIHELSRQRLIMWTRRRLKQQLEARGTDSEQVRRAIDALNPNALTIGFARRFATYKRGTLVMRDLNRLLGILGNKDRPVQFLISGKSHPADGGGKELIKQIVHIARQHDQAAGIVFLENYDMEVARYLVQGCDVWLNTPRRGMEASGTSGMKAALNGVLNCSVLDGWWDEAFETQLGWGIGRGETYTNVDTQDDIESKALYDLLESHIIPMFYDRDGYGIPRTWVQRMKACISVLAPMFNTNRMVQQYAENLYQPALKRATMLGADGLARARELAHQKYRLRGNWHRVAVEDVKTSVDGAIGVGKQLAIRATVSLGELSPEDVSVEAYVGRLDHENQITAGQSHRLAFEKSEDGKHVFSGELTTDTSGRYGFAIRIVPGGEMFEHVVEPGLIQWEPAAAPAHAEEPAASAHR